MAYEESLKAALRDDEEAPSRPLRLPLEMMVVSVAMPPVLYLLLDPKALQNDPVSALRSLSGVAAYTLVCTLATHAAFAAVPARITKNTSAAWSAATYAATLTVFVVLATIVALPILSPICPGMACDGKRLAVKGVVISLLYAGAGVAAIRARERIVRMRERAQAAREAALEARLRALTARTNPHFLFNSINAGMSLIAIDADRAEDHFAKLSALFRYALDGSSRRFVRLEEELECVSDYLAIESARFGERLTSSIVCDASLALELLPPMVLQPLVENAVVHGVAPRVAGGHVSVVVSRDADTLVLRVENDCDGMAGSRHRGSGTALSDMKERIDIVYGPAATLRTGKAESDSRFVAEVRLPVRAQK